MNIFEIEINEKQNRTYVIQSMDIPDAVIDFFDTLRLGLIRGLDQDVVIDTLTIKFSSKIIIQNKE